MGFTRPVKWLGLWSLRGLGVIEDFGEEGFDGAPGAGVAGGVVGDAGDVPLVLVGEAVLGIAVDDELPVGAGGFHFFGESGDLS